MRCAVPRMTHMTRRWRFMRSATTRRWSLPAPTRCWRCGLETAEPARRLMREGASRQGRTPFWNSRFGDAFHSQRAARMSAMGLFSKDIATMDDLLLHGLKDIYYAENQIIKALPKLIDKATNRDLTKGLRDHLEETKSQITRLEQVFKKLGQEPKGAQCPAIDGLISEADEIAGEVADKHVLDAAIVGSAQAVEHYEIARYGTLIAWAEGLGYDDIIRLLSTNLNEEKAA